MGATNTQQSTPHWSQHRRYELDGLRVLAFSLLIFYHIGMYYVADWDFHIKSPHQSTALQNLMLWANQWRMSLLFLISGAAAAYMLHRKPYQHFFFNRSSRLMIPLIFGIAVVVAPQVYIELKTKGFITEMSYARFWWHYLASDLSLPAVYGRAEPLNITWNHLWFVMYVLCYSILLWLAYPVLSSRLVTSIGARATKMAPMGILLVLPILLNYGYRMLLAQSYPSSHDLVNDWYNHARYATVFLIGYCLVRQPLLWQLIGQYRKLWLGLALVSYAGLVFFYHGGTMPTAFDKLAPKQWVIAINSWLWILAVIGWAQRYLNRPNAIIGYLNGGVFCYYIVHQTLIIIIAYLIAPWQLGPVLEPALIIALTFSGCLISYPLLKRLPVVAAVFGINKNAAR